MEDNKVQKVDENTKQADAAPGSLDVILQEEKLIDPGNEHHHDGGNIKEVPGAGKKGNADAGGDSAGGVDNQPK